MAKVSVIGAGSRGNRPVHAALRQWARHGSVVSQGGTGGGAAKDKGA